LTLSVTPKELEIELLSSYLYVASSILLGRHAVAFLLK